MSFFPSPSEGARRRKNVFGTESKAVVGGFIVGSAVALAAAPAVIAGGGIARAALFISRRSIGTKVGLALATPVAIAIVAGNPKVVTRAAGNLGNLYKNIVKVAYDPSLDNLKNVGKENPATVAAVVLGVAAATGKGDSLGNFFNAQATRENTRIIRDNTRSVANPSSQLLPESFGPENRTESNPLELTPVPFTHETPQKRTESNPLVPAPVPLTRETQVIGKEVKSVSASTKPRKRVAKIQPIRITNRNTLIVGNHNR